MSGPGHPVRRVRCPRCLARRYNRCCTARGVSVSWHHAERTALADTPAIGAPAQPIPAAVAELLAEGLSIREVERRTGIPRTRMYRQGLLVPGQRARSRPGVGRHQRPIPPEVEQWIADRVPMREVARRSGISRSVLYARGFRSGQPRRGPAPPEGGAAPPPTI